MLGVLEGSPAASHQRSPEAAHIRGRKDERSSDFQARSECSHEIHRVVDVLDHLECDDAVKTFGRWDLVDTAGIDVIRAAAGSLACLRGHLGAGPAFKEAACLFEEVPVATPDLEEGPTRPAASFHPAEEATEGEAQTSFLVGVTAVAGVAAFEVASCFIVGLDSVLGQSRRQVPQPT